MLWAVSITCILVRIWILILLFPLARVYYKENSVSGIEFHIDLEVRYLTCTGLDYE